MKQIVIFASGSGTNTERIIKYFNSRDGVRINFTVLSNSHYAKVLERIEPLGVNILSFNQTAFKQTVVLEMVKSINPDLIVLAGFLWKISPHFIECFKKKIINIHPSLLPKYGGKGMYGLYVHKAVYMNKDVETGITIHYVNEDYDKGAIIFQAKIKVGEKDTPQTIAQKVHELEYEHFPKVIEFLL